MKAFILVAVLMGAIATVAWASSHLPYPTQAAVPTQEGLVAGPQLASKTSVGIQGRANCPITPPGESPFVPPAPYSAQAPYNGEFWYGTRDLWTLLRRDGTWAQLPHSDAGYTQKVFWWRQGYNWQAEPLPTLTVAGRRLDGAAPPLVASRATNAYNSEIGSAMLVGVDIPTAGCWEITGHYQTRSLSFVVWLEPAASP